MSIFGHVGILLLGIRHILTAAYRPKSNGELERYHQVIMREMKQSPYEVLGALEVLLPGSLLPSWRACNVLAAVAAGPPMRKEYSL